MRIDRFNTNIEENEGNNVVNCTATIHPLPGSGIIGDSSYICSNGKTGPTLESVWGSGVQQDKIPAEEK